MNDPDGSAGRGPAADRLLLLDVVHAVLGRNAATRWTLAPDDIWCHLSAPGAPLRRHGWKLHVSATPLSAPLVLARAAEVLIRRECSFKFGIDLPRVARLVSGWYDRGSGGKFITAYPRDDEHFRSLAEELHRATLGLAGPKILSDRQLRPGSLVHYRYGQFVGERMLTDEGRFELRMVAPDGSTVADERKAWFTPPPWAPAPFPGQAPVADTAPSSVLLGGRFRVRRAIRHANKGGVFRAVDEHDGAEVIVKQARAHVDARLDGTDARDRLRAEARMLDILGPSVAPRLVAIFEEEDDLFLVEEAVPGTSLDKWAVQRVDEGGVERAAAVALARQLVAVIRAVHDVGLVICDLKPHNLIVSATGDLRMIDVEYVARPGQGGSRGLTEVYAAPEFVAALGRGDHSVPGPEVDCHSLGVTVFSALTGLAPEWVSGRPGVRPSGPALGRLLGRIGQAHPVLVPFIELIVGLTDADPAQRWSLSRAAEFLRDMDSTPAVPPRRSSRRVPVPMATLDRLIADGLTQLRRASTPQRTTLWPANRLRGEDFDPCSAWLGAAGVLSTLTRAARAADDGSLTDVVARTAGWIDERLFAVPRLLPGLAVGRSGTAWALHDAAVVLGDERLAARARELAGRLPLRWPVADVNFGLAGAGLAHLHLWQATGDLLLRHRALAYAEEALAAAWRHGDTWLWPSSTQTDSALAGRSRYGFAHGVAGVGAFLLAAAQATGVDTRNGARLREAAIGAGETLAAAAHADRGGASWPLEAGGAAGLKDLWWCNGPSGIGEFLIRLWASTGRQRFADLAEQAANTVVADPWRASHSACCGVAGGGHFLLDMAEITGDQRYRAHAEHLAGVIHAQHTVRDGLMLTGGPTGGTDYASGSAGVLGFLLRLRHGGPRPWMPRYEMGPPQPAVRHLRAVSPPTRGVRQLTTTSWASATRAGTAG